MKQDSVFYPLKLILGFLVIVAVGLLFTGCGTPMRIEYQNPKYGAGAVEFTLPKKEGYAK